MALFDATAPPSHSKFGRTRNVESILSEVLTGPTMKSYLGASNTQSDVGEKEQVLTSNEERERSKDGEPNITVEMPETGKE